MGQAIVAHRVTRTESGGWRLTWGPTIPPYFVGPYSLWADNTFFATLPTGLTTYDVLDPRWEERPPNFELQADEATSLPDSDLYPPYTRLTWRGDPDAVGYVVEEYVSGAWVQRSSLLESGQGYYWYDTPAREDGDTVQWRVVPVDFFDYAGDPVLLTVTVDRNPRPPSALLDLSMAGDVVVSEA